MSLSQKAYTTDSEFPALEKGKIRLYSMKICPYAQRARIVLAHKNIEYEEVNIHLKNKPKWFLERNPLGKVPCYEKDGILVYESVVVCDYLDAVYPGPKLTPSDPYRRAQDSMLLERYVQVPAGYYGVMRTRAEDQEQMDKLYQGLTVLEEELAARGSPFFGGDDPAMIDFVLWPHMERVVNIKYVFSQVEVKAETYPKVTAWINRITSVPAVQKTVESSKIHAAFWKSAISGQANYDIWMEE